MRGKSVDMNAFWEKTGLDPAGYKMFNKLPNRLDDSPCSLTGIPDVPVRPGTRTSAPLATKALVPRRDPSWQAMRSLVGPARGSLDHASEALLGGRLPAGSVSFFPCCGGVGLTSLLAAASRLLSTKGERVCTVEEGPGSLLPLYFGGQADAWGGFTYMPRRDSGEGAVHILSTRGELEPEESTLWENILERGRSVDRVLIGAWRGMSNEHRPLLASQSTCVAVLTPDVNGMAGLQRIGGAFSETAQANTFLVLLSRFDPTLPLHVEARRMLSARFGDRLLPFTIRRSDVVGEALAEGTTVIDYAPESGVAEDLGQLIRWLDKNRIAPKSMSAAAGD